MSDQLSMGLAVLTAVGLIVWVVVTHQRVGETGTMGLPQYWLTAATPVWAALIMLGLQMLCLSSSAITATRREQMGIADMMTSIATFVVIVVLIVLVVIGYAKSGPNLINGLAAFTFASFVEMLATMRVWMVANRRPGGVIGGMG
jgi:hypothetical protein